MPVLFFRVAQASPILRFSSIVRAPVVDWIDVPMMPSLIVPLLATAGAWVVVVFFTWPGAVTAGVAFLVVFFLALALASAPSAPATDTTRAKAVASTATRRAVTRR